ncbi:ATP-binding cassette domain-containing protein [Streptomyces iconiensis]|uniref:ATP-binding cassette domain-containing protein n=1 Tax=Streptomyces iconiensis TaxID=1384038 RepID=A0ABT6ZUT7_9ACTN|nr:ATP-binding cassette domain-containing protein [Streptomyces iconiensis]MDJ1132818.1 ATP-binding cassette domain-containing protein [Streptomyces iconiensis]
MTNETEANESGPDAKGPNAKGPVETGPDETGPTATGPTATEPGDGEPRDGEPKDSEPLVSLSDVSKFYGNIRALEEVSLQVHPGEITCVLGDNGAGKSTLIKIISGLHQHDAGSFRIQGEETRLGSPREALDRGIATVYQDLAVVPLMPVWRNFFLGSEPSVGRGPLKRLDVQQMRRTTHRELLRMGIDLRDVDQPIGTLSGGERQSVAIARAIHFGAKVLVLDEPTAALGVKQSGVVLKYVAAARDAGLGVVLITHNPHHAYLVGDRFVLLKRGAMAASYEKEGLELEELVRQMAGGSELEELSHELER